MPAPGVYGCSGFRANQQCHMMAMASIHVQEVPTRSAFELENTIASDSAAALPVTITVVRSPQPSALHPIQALLRRRLLTLALVFALIAGLGTAAFLWSRVLPALREGTSVRPAVWTGLAVYAVLLALSVVYALVLWRWRPLSLRALRIMEVAGFSSIAICEVWRIVVTWRAGEVFRLVSANAFGMLLLSSRQSLVWFALIVAYGTFIPNTWRRCAIVVGILAATPIVSVAISNALLGYLDSRLLSVYLFDLAIWMIAAGALAVYGSHRIDVLRNDALEARKLGQYQLQRRLGAGGMGEVYLAEHLLLRRPCAIKMIRPDRAGDPEMLLRFEREVQTTAALTHPNTVQVYDYGHTEDGTFYYVMEYLQGLTLEELVQRHGPLSATRTLHVLRQVCAALREAHAVGLIHRDVKPGNIMLCERGGEGDVAKLVDFGIVQSLGAISKQRSTSSPRAIAGTPSYMSPEQITGTDVDARSDIYSLGGVGYFLLTGTPPFVRATVAQTADAHLRAAVIPPDQIQPDVPADLQSIILRCLSKNPDERYQSATMLREALAQCVRARSERDSQPIIGLEGVVDQNSGQ